MLIIWYLVLSSHRFPFMGQSVTGTQSSEGQHLLSQSITQVLLLVTSPSRVQVPVSHQTSLFIVRPLLESSWSHRTLPECYWFSRNKDFLKLLFEGKDKSLKMDNNLWKGSIYLRVESYLEENQMLRFCFYLLLISIKIFSYHIFWN